MKRIAIVLWMCAVAVPLCFGAGGVALGSAESIARMLPTEARVGTYQVQHLDTARWLGLFAAPEGYELRIVTPASEPAPDGPFDRPGEPPAEHLVSAVGEALQPHYLFAGLPTLGEGPVHSLLDGYVPMRPGTINLGQFRLGQSDALRGLLVVEGTPLPESPDSYEGYTLTMRRWDDGVLQTQVLLDGRTRGTVPALVWAGDLDGDGKLDVMIDAVTSIEGSGTWLKLYLSTHAAEGELVGLAAEIAYGGC